MRKAAIVNGPEDKPGSGPKPFDIVPAAEANPEDPIERLRRHHKRMRELGYVPPSVADLERLDRMIAGEE